MDEPIILGVPAEDLSSLSGASAGDGGAMMLQVLRDAEAVIVVVHGEIDLLTVNRLGEALSAELGRAPKALVLDLDDVDFLGSMGLTVIALAERAASQKEIPLRVVASSRVTLRPLQITGLLDQLAVYASRREALAGLLHGPGSTAGPQLA